MKCFTWITWGQGHGYGYYEQGQEKGQGHGLTEHIKWIPLG